MNDKIKVEKPLVILHGDEMAQVAFERIMERFVGDKLEIELVEIDLTAENRLVRYTGPSVAKYSFARGVTMPNVAIANQAMPTTIKPRPCLIADRRLSTAE